MNSLYAASAARKWATPPEMLVVCTKLFLAMASAKSVPDLSNEDDLLHQIRWL
jgi:hypothetical protein